MAQSQQAAAIAALVEILKANGVDLGDIAKTAKSGPASPDRLSAKDKAIRSTFTKRGYKDVVLMDRSDKSKPFNVRPFKGWLEQGRVVRKGEKSVRGLFHVSQTDLIPADANQGIKTVAKPNADKPKLTLADLGKAVQAKATTQPTA